MLREPQRRRLDIEDGASSIAKISGDVLGETAARGGDAGLPLDREALHVEVFDGERMLVRDAG